MFLSRASCLMARTSNVLEGSNQPSGCFDRMLDLGLFNPKQETLCGSLYLTQRNSKLA